MNNKNRHRVDNRETPAREDSRTSSSRLRSVIQKTTGRCFLPAEALGKRAGKMNSSYIRGFLRMVFAAATCGKRPVKKNLFYTQVLNIALFAATALSFFLAPLPAAAAGPDDVTAIKGGTILTMAGAPIPNGTIVIRDGRIAGIGTDIAVPAGARVVDASGKYIMPGLIDAMTYFGIRPVDQNDLTNPATPENRALIAFSPAGANALLRGGITTIYIAPGNRQVVGGQGAVVKLFGRHPEGTVILDPAALDMTLGDPVKTQFGEGKRSPATRMNIAALLRKTLDGGRAYMAKAAKGAAADAAKAPANPAMEAVAAVLGGRIPARIEADLADDIRTAVRLADEYGFKAVIDGGEGAWKVADLLAAKRIPVVLGPVSHRPASGQIVRESPERAALRNEENAALLTKAGVKIALAGFGFASDNAGSFHEGRWLLLHASLLTGFGLSDEDAMRAVTINAAEILGVADRIGSLEKGKDADIVILDGPPLGLKTRVEKVFVNGVPVGN